MSKPDIYTSQERLAFRAPRCPSCGHQGDWRSAAWRGWLATDGDVLWSRGRITCSRCGQALANGQPSAG